MPMQNAGHDFAADVRREHAELRAILADLAHRLEHRVEPVSASVRQLIALRSHLETHFLQEESAGFFDEVARRSPWLADKAAALRAEHDVLRQTLRDLLHHAEEADGSEAWWKCLDEGMRSFSGRLLAHEAAENELLINAYEQDIGDKD